MFFMECKKTGGASFGGGSGGVGFGGLGVGFSVGSSSNANANLTNSNFANADSKNSNLGDSANPNSNFGSLASRDGINFKAVLSGETDSQNTEFINQPSDEIIKNTLEYYQQDNSQNAHLTIYVHGTFASNETNDKPLINAISQTFNEEVMQFGWSGENTREARAKAAADLAKYIENYKFSEGEKLNAVAHSHGGNVLKWLTQIYTGEKKVDNVIFLGTPVREDYKVNFNAISPSANILNVYDKNDLVQVGGGTDTVFYVLPISTPKFANRTIQDTRVKNVEIETVGNKMMDFDDVLDNSLIRLINNAIHGVDAHGNVRTAPIWNKFIDSNIQKR